VISSDGKSMTTKATGNLVLQETITRGPSSGQGQVRPSEQPLRISIDTTLRVTVEYGYCLSGFSTIIFPRKAILTAFGCPFCKYGSNSQPKAAFRTFGEMWATRHPYELCALSNLFRKFFAHPRKAASISPHF
jgi:hypothetical protein